MTRNVEQVYDLFNKQHSKDDPLYVESLAVRANTGDACALFKLLHLQSGNDVFGDIEVASRITPDYTRFMEAFSRGQLQSKKWLIDELRNTGWLQCVDEIAIVGGWYGVMAYLLANTPTVNLTDVHSIDIDPACKPVVETLCRGLPVTAITADMHDIDYARYGVVINTSCEHIDNFDEWYDKIPSDCLVILQSNNYYDHPEHVNCVSSLDEFARMAPMGVFYQGELELSKYTRYMRIGQK